jgi:hypothetical protein
MTTIDIIKQEQEITRQKKYLRDLNHVLNNPDKVDYYGFKDLNEVKHLKDHTECYISDLEKEINQ